jgi:hypothetical protein
MSAYPKSTKKADNFKLFFALLGSVSVKAARKMLVKLTPVVVLILWQLFQNLERFFGCENLLKVKICLLL